jgi:hypothetical protein
MDVHVSPAAEMLVFLQDWGSLLLRVGTQTDNFVLVQISPQFTQVLALETDPAARANFASMLELSRDIGSYISVII